MVDDLLLRNINRHYYYLVLCLQDRPGTSGSFLISSEILPSVVLLSVTRSGRVVRVSCQDMGNSRRAITAPYSNGNAPSAHEMFHIRSLEPLNALRPVQICSNRCDTDFARANPAFYTLL